MIGHLRGKIIKISDSLVIIEVNDVGWKVFLGVNTLAEIGKNKEKAEVFTYLYNRDNTQELYGFRNYEELTFFEMLLGVSGVGPRHALIIIDSIPLKQIVGSLREGASDIFTGVPGIGTRTAQKIVIELQNKIKKLGLKGEIDLSILAEEGDAIKALKSLGYSQQEARESLDKVSDQTKGLSKRIEEALRILGKPRV